MPEPLRHTIRAQEWWSHKRAAIIGMGYGTVLFAGGDVLDAALQLGLGLAALIPGAAFVSILNDYTDLELDRRARKKNRLEGRSRAYGRRLIASTIALGVIMATALAMVEPWSLIFYLPAWLAFAAYSLRPLRLKERGWMGALADALGAHVFPQLVVVALAFAGANDAIEWGWTALVGGWSLAYGLRGAIWHQSTDITADKATGVATLVASRPRLALWMTRWVLVPFELATIAAILNLIGSPIPVAAFLLYLALELGRSRLWKIEIVLVGAEGRYRIFMHEYYAIILPLALLAAASIADPANLLMVGIHLLLFGTASARAGLDLVRATSEIARSQIAFVRRKIPGRLRSALAEFLRRS